MIETSWQDAIITGGQVMFIFALLPAVFDRKSKPPLSTCVLTGLVLLAFGYVFYTLRLWFGSVTSVLCRLLWLCLAVQQWRKQ